MRHDELIRKILLVMFLLVAFGAIPAGIALVAKPDGSNLMLDATMLRYNVFNNFLVPGLVLLFLVGIGHLTTVLLFWKKSSLAPVAGFSMGNILIGWIVVQIMLIGYASWMQPFFFSVGLAEVLLSFSVWKPKTHAPGS